MYNVYILKIFFFLVFDERKNAVKLLSKHNTFLLKVAKPSALKLSNTNDT